MVCLLVKTSRRPAIFFLFRYGRHYLLSIHDRDHPTISSALQHKIIITIDGVPHLSRTPLSQSHIGKWKEAVEVGSPAAGACHDPREGAAQRPPVSGGAPSPDE